MDFSRKKLSQNEFNKINLIRLFQIIKLLNNCKRTLHNLALLTNVSTRTIQRDIDQLLRMGVPLVKDHLTNEFYMVSNYTVPPINFTQMEILAIFILFSQYSNEIKQPLFSVLRTAILKFASYIPTDLFALASHIGHNVKIHSFPKDVFTEYEKIFDTILDALASTKVIALEYDSVTERDIIYTNVQPYEVYFTRSWYLIGFSSLHREIRTFKLMRIQSVTPKDISYEIPINFSLSSYLGNAWRCIPEPGKDWDIVVRFSPKVAQNVSETLWHQTQEERWLSDGSVELRFCVSGLNEIVWWLLGYGSEANVIKPIELQRMIVDHARKMINLYQ
ncbi:MAG: WYL domain-containing protein [Planctomycetia bacterium]|nr:WYL domain-containing protein [Planctomycetia bacterium]